MEENKVVPIRGEVDGPTLPSIEEVQAVMKKDEEEMDRYLARFPKLNEIADTSEIEDDEEEIITLDFDKNIAYEKVMEGIAVVGTGNVDMIDLEEKPEPAKPTLQQKYQDMITDRFISKAVASLVAKMNDVGKEVFDTTSDKLPPGIGDNLACSLHDKVMEQKRELLAAIAGGKVHYDIIPEWAKPYIDDYVLEALNTLIDFVERD